MLLDENDTSRNLCLGTIMRSLSWNKQNTIQSSSFEAHSGRLSKTEFKFLRVNFLSNSDHIDKEHLERSGPHSFSAKKTHRPVKRESQDRAQGSKTVGT